MHPLVIALLGMPGSGKTEAIQYLEERYGWPKVYFGSITFDEVAKRGLPLTPENERIVREDLRNTFGKDHYAKEVIRRVDAISSDVVLIESLYMWTEHLTLKDHYGGSFKMIAIHASPEIRYERLEHRSVRPFTREQAIERDRAQIEFLEQGGPIAMADVMLVNEGEREDLFVKLDEAIALIHTPS